MNLVIFATLLALLTAVGPVQAVGTGAPAPADGQQPSASDPLPGDGWLGVRAAVTVHLAADGSSSPATPLTVTRVYPGSPAGRAGVRPGDIVVALNGQPTRLERFRSLSQRLLPGDPIKLTIERDGRPMEFALEAGHRPEPEVFVPSELQRALDSTRSTFVDRLASVASALGEGAPFRVDIERIRAETVTGVVVGRGAAESPGPRGTRAGGAVVGRATPRGPSVASAVPDRVTGPYAVPRGAATPRAGDHDESRQSLALAVAQVVRPLAPYVNGANRVAGAGFTPVVPELGAYFGTATGLLVTDVAERTPAGDAGLKSGDVIIAVEGRQVESIEHFRAVLASAGSPVTLSVIRRGLGLRLRLPT